MAADTARNIDADKSDGEREIERVFTLQKQAYRNEPFPSYDQRIANIEKVIRLTEGNEQKFIDAICADFGNRARHETIIAEIVVTVSGAKLAKKNLRRWMRPHGVPTPLHMLPSKSKIEPQPLGVVGIISPWNYPLQLALAPAIAPHLAARDAGVSLDARQLADHCARIVASGTDLVVIELFWRQIDWIRKTKEKTHKASSSGDSDVTEFNTYVDLKLNISEAELKQIKLGLAKERNNKPLRSEVSQLRHELFRARKNKAAKHEI